MSTFQADFAAGPPALFHNSIRIDMGRSLAKQLNISNILSQSGPASLPGR